MESGDNTEAGVRKGGGLKWATMNGKARAGAGG